VTMSSFNKIVLAVSLAGMLICGGGCFREFTEPKVENCESGTCNLNYSPPPVRYDEK